MSEAHVRYEFWKIRKTMNVPKGMQVHHIDGNPSNNDPTNLMVVTPFEHILIDGRLENLRNPHPEWHRYGEERKRRLEERNESRRNEIAREVS